MNQGHALKLANSMIAAKNIHMAGLGTVYRWQRQPGSYLKIRNEDDPSTSFDCTAVALRDLRRDAGSIPRSQDLACAQTALQLLDAWTPEDRYFYLVSQSDDTHEQTAVHLLHIDEHNGPVSTLLFLVGKRTLVILLDTYTAFKGTLITDGMQQYMHHSAQQTRLTKTVYMTV